MGYLCPVDDHVAAEALKRQPAHISPDLAAQIQVQIELALAQRPDGLIGFTDPLARQTFALPREVWCLPLVAREQLLKQALDNNAQQALEGDAGDRVVNWCFQASSANRLLAFWNGATGDCLLDAVAQAAWGIPVALSHTLRRLREAMATKYVHSAAFLSPSRAVLNVLSTFFSWFALSL